MSREVAASDVRALFYKEQRRETLILQNNLRGLDLVQVFELYRSK